MSDDPGFDAVRTTLESAFALPIAVALSSTQPGDGKTQVAVGTARAFSRAGFATLVIDANPASPAVATRLGLASAIATPPALAFEQLTIASVAPLLFASSIADHKLFLAATPAQMAALVAAVRERYAVVIFDLCEVFFDRLAVQCAAACDATVLAIRAGRNPEIEDARVMAALAGSGAHVVGSVETDCRERRPFFTFA